MYCHVVQWSNVKWLFIYQIDWLINIPWTVWLLRLAGQLHRRYREVFRDHVIFTFISLALVNLMFYSVLPVGKCSISVYWIKISFYCWAIVPQLSSENLYHHIKFKKNTKLLLHDLAFQYWESNIIIEGYFLEGGASI